MELRVGVVEPVRAEPPQLVAAMRRLGTAGADPIRYTSARKEAGQHVIEFVSRPQGWLTDAKFRLDVSRGQATMTARTEIPIPFFAWLYRPFLRGAFRAGMRKALHDADLLACDEAVPTTDTGGEDGPSDDGGKAPWYAPPTDFTARQAAMLASAAMLAVCVGYSQSVFSQAADPIAETFAVSDAALGTALGVTRVGALVAILGAVLADRAGRRRVLLVGLAAMSVFTAAGALAPTFPVFTGTQVLARGFTILVAAVTGIVVIEEAPERGRAYSLSMILLAGVGGYAISTLLLPLADLGPQTWRILPAVGILGLALMPALSRHLEESCRFAAISTRLGGARTERELVDRRYGARFGLLLFLAFLGNIAVAPAGQFTIRYLQDAHDFSGLSVLLFRALATGLMFVVGLWIGGIFAEVRGRRLTALLGGLISGAATIVFFLSSGAFLWIGQSIAALAGAFATLAFAAFSTELFPTETRGTANAALILAGVSGAAIGLVAVGYLSESLDSLGLAVALAQLVGMPALLAIPFLPEPRGRDLDDVSPSEI